MTSVFLYAEPSQTGAFLDEAAAAGVEHIALFLQLRPRSGRRRQPDRRVASRRRAGASPHLAVEDEHPSAGRLRGHAFQWRWALESAARSTCRTRQLRRSHPRRVHRRGGPGAFALFDPAGAARQDVRPDRPRSLTFTATTRHPGTCGRQPLPLHHGDLREAWRRPWPGYMPGAFADGLLDYWASTDGSPTPLTHAVEELTGHPARSFAAWAAENARRLQNGLV